MLLPEVNCIPGGVMSEIALRRVGRCFERGPGGRFLFMMALLLAGVKQLAGGSAFGCGETVGWGLRFWLGVKLLARKCCHVEKNVNFVKIGKLYHYEYPTGENQRTCRA